MHYDGYIFTVLWWDNGHVLLRSQYREDVAHAVEISQEKHTCTCENFSIDKNPECKHIRYVKWISNEVEKLHRR